MTHEPHQSPRHGMSFESPTDVLSDLPAPAKLNHFLHIVGRRADGYHLLQSLFVLIDWQDTLSVARRDDGLVTRQDIGAKLPEDDLSVRAARALQAASGTHHGVHITIDKQVPWGAGLGGGSSDAATVLIALNRLWSLDWPRARLIELGLRLGADVPFFLGGRAALVQGIGEQLVPVDVPLETFLVVKPREPLATAEVFAHAAVVRNTAALTPAAILAGFLDSGHQKPFGHNDLQLAAEAVCPAVRQAIDALERWVVPGSNHGLHGRMSGSGSAVFARLGPLPPPNAVADDPAVERGAFDLSLATMLERCKLLGWTARVCRSLSRHPLDGWLRD